MQRQRRSQESGPELVTASEIAAFVYCQEAWRLEPGLGLEPGNREALDAGTRYDEGKAVAERVTGGAVAVGRLVAVLAVVVLLLLWMLSR